ncbi:ComEC/Rec2 family competence protein [Nitratireductor pacificus]|uniref:ComEC/Rec2-like protein n=1 Tax=Nitratireductor pacificus pht-3B TaxID=391937 RepID=K2MQE0_9HYPH|nr:ComEC/Rec2 family competence protein [Nitratireductor pacificus]EKF19522.1 ComEC/Rec2-like protein [Nitratireductor pacificus pht-3B]
MGGRTATAEQDERIQFDAGNPAGSMLEGMPARTSPATRGATRARVFPVAGNLARLTTREEARGTGFLWLPVLLGCGALVYFTLPMEPPAHAVLSAVLACTAALFLVSGNVLQKRLLLALLTVLLGFAAGKLETWRASTPMLGSEITTRVTGRVLGIEHRADGRHRLTLAVTETERPRLRYAPDQVRVTARAIPAGLRPGDGVKGLARLVPPSGPVRPNAYDFSFESYFDGVGAIGFFLRDPERAPLSTAAPIGTRLSIGVQVLREAFADRLRERLPGPEGEIAAALIAGVRAGIPEEANEVLRRTGLAHILSISGLHMALVAFTVIGAVRLGFAFFPGVCARYPVKKYAAAAALLVCLLYLFISGAAVAAQRSFIMLAVMLVAQLLDRAALTMRNLAIAALIVIALSPHEVIGPGFQMSFAATAALIAGYAAWNRWRERRMRGRHVQQERTRLQRVARSLLLYAGGLALTSLIAGTATALYGAWHFQRASPLALGANLAAMPLVSVIVMPSAVLSVLAMPLNLDGWPLAAMGWGIARVVEVATWFSERTPFDATGLVPVPAVILLTGALALMTLTTTRLWLAAFPLIIAGGVLLLARDLPDVLISEDARLVATRTADGRLAVNRSRPNGFTMKNWLHAMWSQERTGPRAGDGSATADPETFGCEADVCIARHTTGALVAHVKTPRAEGTDHVRLRTLCPSVQLLVIEDPTVGAPCRAGEATVVTGRDLALRGSAQVHFKPAGGGRHEASVAFAIREPFRPWHAHRQFARAARGLGPRSGRAPR